MSTPEQAPESTGQQAAAPLRRKRYGTDSASLIADYPGFAIMSFMPGGTYGARAKTRDTGEVYGDLLTGIDLDELADKMDLS